MSEEHKKSSEKKHHLDKFREIGKWFLLVFGVILSLGILAYAALAIISTQLSLPGLKFNGQNVGLKKVSEISKIVNQEKGNFKAQVLTFQFQDKSVQRSLQSLGVGIDVPQTTSRIFTYGKKETIFPSFGYIKDIFGSNLRIKPYIVKSSDFENQIQGLFNERQEPKNAELVLENNELKIVPEVNGFKIDTNTIRNLIEQRLASNNFSNIISANTIPIRSSVNTADLNLYINDIRNYIGQSVTLTSSTKKIGLKNSNILSFIDLERTVLSQTITLSDEAINSYLGSIEKQVDQKGTDRKISSLDNSVLDEGKEGKKLDLEKTRENIKNALSNKNKTAELVITTSPISERIISPGYNPGMYPGKYIEVNLTQQMLYALEGQNLVKSYKVSTGKWSMPTPEGEYSINNKDPRAYSSSYNLYMPYWMAFIGSEYGIHELPEWADGTKEGESHLGTPVSHGCVRLGRGAAQDVYDWTEIGTPVYIHK